MASRLETSGACFHPWWESSCTIRDERQPKVFIHFRLGVEKGEKETCDWQSANDREVFLAKLTTAVAYHNSEWSVARVQEHVMVRGASL